MMDDTTALILAIGLIGLFLVDYLFFGGHLPIFLFTKITNLIDYMAFWR